MFKYLFVLFFICLVSCSEGKKNQSIVFMDNAKIFEGFQMKKDYDALIEKDLHNELLKLDSLGILLQNKESDGDTLELFKLRKDYYLLEQLYTSKLQELSSKYTGEVNQRLNDYIKSYSEKKGYDLVLGSGNSGSVMYVSSETEITEDLLSYINQEYAK